jgi:hypothetical protein
MIYVLKKKGWAITEETVPTVYERDDRYDNDGFPNVLIITDVRKQNLVFATFLHLNVFIHSLGNSCDVEIRYEARTPVIKQFTSVRNDQMVQDILDAVDQEINK